MKSLCTGISLRRKTLLLPAFICSLAIPLNSLAWGKTGHEIVAEIALQSLKETTREQVQHYLDKTSPESASVWMDDMRSNHDYDFMKPWHYINIPEGAQYQASNEENILNTLTIAYRELQHKNTLCADQAKKDLMILFHLIGDLHQPLHTGYAADKGGNDIKISFNGIPSNLHWIWDDQIIQQQHITLQDCLAGNGQLSPEERKKVAALDFVQWMNASRAYLPEVYRFTGNNIDEAYCARNKALIEKQLLYAGLRLAAVLESVFATPEIQAAAATEKKTGSASAAITATEARNFIGKEVTVCGKVYGGKFLAQSKGTPTFLNIGAAFPNSPFTVVIFGDDRSSFRYKPEEYLDGKDICVTGRIKEYKGKPEIIVSGPAQIKVQ